MLKMVKGKNTVIRARHEIEIRRPINNPDCVWFSVIYERDIRDGEREFVEYRVGKSYAHDGEQLNELIYEVLEEKLPHLDAEHWAMVILDELGTFMEEEGIVQN